MAKVYVILHYASEGVEQIEVKASLAAAQNWVRYDIVEVCKLDWKTDVEEFDHDPADPTNILRCCGQWIVGDSESYEIYERDFIRILTCGA